MFSKLLSPLKYSVIPLLFSTLKILCTEGLAKSQSITSVFLWLKPSAFAKFVETQEIMAMINVC
jgi:hypothetical protein